MIWLNSEFRNVLIETVGTGIRNGDDAERIKNTILDSISPEDFGYNDLGIDGDQAISLYFQSIVDLICEVIKTTEDNRS